MSKEYKYTYKFSEQSVDVRHWEVQSNKKLTEEEMLDLGFSTDLRNEGSVIQMRMLKLLLLVLIMVMMLK